MPFVVDASVTSAWALSDEKHAVAERAYRLLRSDAVCVPALWWFETRNTLVVNERRGRLTESDSTAFLHQLSRLPITADLTPDESALLRLARAHKLTVYDAAYLELAQRRGLALATLDKELLRAARDEGIPVVREP
jgi:predicted nucleic acid-binding protein